MFIEWRNEGISSYQKLFLFIFFLYKYIPSNFMKSYYFSKTKTNIYEEYLFLDWYIFMILDTGFLCLGLVINNT